MMIISILTFFDTVFYFCFKSKKTKKWLKFVAGNLFFIFFFSGRGVWQTRMRVIFGCVCVDLRAFFFLAHVRKAQGPYSASKRRRSRAPCVWRVCIYIYDTPGLCGAYRCFLSASLYTYLMHPGWILCACASLSRIEADNLFARGSLSCARNDFFVFLDERGPCSSFAPTK